MYTNISTKKADTRQTQNIRKTFRKICQNYELYIFLLPAVAAIIIFRYVPMYGVQIAFKDYIVTKGVTGSPWIGFHEFERFFNSYQFLDVLKNTLLLSIYQIIGGFPIPIILALLLNSAANRFFKKFVQTATYAPYFISTVVLVSMLTIFLSPRNGLINEIVVLFGGQPVLFMGKPEWFKTLYVLSGIWQHSGWGAIIYIAALAGVDPELHTAAIVDGASKLKRIIYIDLPCILPTIAIMLILSIGSLMSIGFDKVFLMQNSLNLSSSEMISTYVFKVGLGGGNDYSYATAVGLFNSVVNFILLIGANKLSKINIGISLW